MSTADEPDRAPTTRGRPRDEELDRRVLDAGFTELAQAGISHFSVAAVARLAGVAKGSIYLRWPTREQLIFESATQLVSPITAAGPGPFRQQLEEFADQWAAALARPRAMEVLLRVDADRDQFPELFARIFHHMQGSGNRLLVETIEKAQANGDITSSVSSTLLNRVFVGAMFVEALAHTPAGHVGVDFRAQLVDFLMHALESQPER